MNFDKARERYQNEPEFNQIVTIFYNLLAQNRFTISELKDALLFAGLKFEQEHIRPIVFKKGEINFREE